jgi:hypothetical protein
MACVRVLDFGTVEESFHIRGFHNQGVTEIQSIHYRQDMSSEKTVLSMP